MTSRYQKPVLDFVYSGDTDVRSFIHRTSRSNAEMIVKEGFKFYRGLNYSTDFITSTPKAVFFLNERDIYGDSVVVINIHTDIIVKYLNLSETPTYHFEWFLSAGMPEYRENKKHLTYILHKKFVKGFVYLTSQEIFRNKDFNPSYDHSRFEVNARNSSFYSEYLKGMQKQSNR